MDQVYERLGAHYTELMILDLIVSKNMARRQLNAGQRALMALEYEKHYAEAVKAAEAERKGAAVGDNSARRGSSTSTSTLADLRESGEWVEPQVRREQWSSERAAKVVGASGRAVQQAKAVQRDAPDLAAKVRAGEIALDAADRPARPTVASRPRLRGPVTRAPRTSTKVEVLQLVKTSDLQSRPCPGA
ncbi:hypothetical protein ACPCK3_07370 [Streptomyces griseoincarnatus]